MKARICTPLFLAALALVSCEQYDTPAGRARITRAHVQAYSSPAPENPVVSQKQPVIKKEVPAASAPVAAPLPEPEVKKPEPRPVVSQQQPVAQKPVPATPAPVATPLPEPAKPIVKKPEPSRSIVSQQQPAVRPATQPATYYAPSNTARLPLAPKRNYPLMPGQNRGLKARVY